MFGRHDDDGDDKDDEEDKEVKDGEDDEEEEDDKDDEDATVTNMKVVMRMMMTSDGLIDIL